MPTVIERIVEELPEIIVVAVQPHCTSFGELTSRGAYYGDEMIRYIRQRFPGLHVVCSSEHEVDRAVAKKLEASVLVTPALNEWGLKNTIGNTRIFLTQRPAEGHSCRRIVREAQQFVFRELRKKGRQACIVVGPVVASCLWKIFTRKNIQSWCNLFQYDCPRPGSVTVYARRDGYYEALRYNKVPGDR